MQTISPLAQALWPKARRRILGLLLTNPDREWHLRDIARTTRLAPATIQREVTSLHRAGILTRRRVGHQVHYGANRNCPVFVELRALIAKTVGVADVLRRTLGEHESDIELALVFGSLAQGTDRPESDVDLLIVGEVRLQDLVRPLREAEATLSREVNCVAMRKDEFLRRIAEREHLVSAIVREPKIFVFGDEDDLGRLAEGG